MTDVVTAWDEPKAAPAAAPEAAPVVSSWDEPAKQPLLERAAIAAEPVVVPALKAASAVGKGYPLVEAGANLFTAGVLGFPAYVGGGVGTLAARAMGMTDADPKAVGERLAHAVTFQPISEEGKALTEQISYPLTKLMEASTAGGEKVTDVTGSPVAGAVTEGTIQMVPALAGAFLPRGANAATPKRAVHEQLNEIRPVEQAEPKPAAEPPPVVTEWAESAKPAAEAPVEAAKPAAEAAPEPVKPGASVEPAPPGQAPEVVTGWQEAAEAPKSLESLQPGESVTLYRGESAANEASGQWWTTDRAKAEKYGTVTEITLPAEVVGKNAAMGHGGPDEFVFPNAKPQELAAKGPDIVEMNAGFNPKATIEAVKASPLGQKAAEFGAKIVDDLQMKLTPMAAKTATDTSRAVAKEFANQERLARWQWSRFDDILNKNYTPEQRAAMGKALDEQSVLEQTGQDTAGKGLATLPEDQRQAIAVINQHGRQLWERAKAMGMVQGEGLPSYMPRMVVNIGEDGKVTRLPSKGQGGIGEFSDPSGQNITTTTPNLRQRKYLTAAETEAAAKEHFGEGSTLVTDIRALPAALSRFERAIAGRELIDQIKTIGKETGKELVSENEGPTSFTIDHPAFKTYRPRFVTDEATGKTTAMLDQQGNPVFDKVPLYVANEFKGPLKSIMSEKSGAVYNALMSLKGKTMSVIMYSPLIHNEVEFGRAFALMPIEMSKVGLAKGYIPVPKIYLEGNRIKHQPEAMREAISNGLVPIGKRFGFQDITGMMEEPNVKPGRSITAQVLGGAVGLVSKKAGEAVKRGVDTAGDVWHNTLLWDRVGDLQMGLYGKFKEKALAKGLDEKEASILAAHFANRYAGVIPNEATSAGFRKASNFIFFSRSFTGGNIGAMKDAVMGMPRDVVAQLRNAGADEAAQANASELSRTYAQRKAIGAIVKDVALAHLGVALVTSALDYYHEQDFEKILEGYRDRWERLLETAAKDPWDASNPFEDLRALSPTSENEAGKQDRIRVGTQEDGTAIYMRLPLGKIGEEMEGYMVSPVEMMRRKVGTIIRPLIQVYTNDQGYGREVYNPNAKTLPDMIKAVFDAAIHVATNQFPVDSATAAKDIVKDVKEGREPKKMDELKAIGPLAGVTFSKGAPGGPAIGEMFDVEKRHHQDVQRIQKDVKKMIENGEIEPAIEKMRAVRMNDMEILLTLKYAQNPAARLGGRRLGKFYQHAPEADREKMERLLEKQ